MKRLIKSVELVFFQDDSTGEYGLTHKETYNKEQSFNAFWTGFGIFHDVFEHSHEYTNKYFRQLPYAMNISGEMVAMGGMWYYYSKLGVYNRLNSSSWTPPSSQMKNTTLDEIKESIGGYPRYGYTLESKVPKQAPVEDSELEYQIYDFWKSVKSYNDYNEMEQEKQDGKIYKKSVTFRKIADNHRYGYRLSQRLVPRNYENRNMMVEFIDSWEKFCKRNDAESMHDIYKGVIFDIYKDKGAVSWKAKFLSNTYEIEDLTITPKNINHIDYEYL